MRRLRSALCALCLVLLMPLLARAWRVLPMDRQPLVAEKYAGWSGVLRLWVYEGWQAGSGSVMPWLNRCVSRFERRHAGVYVQPQSVDAGAIASMNDSGILPPDMLLVPPGLFASPAGLVPLEVPDSLRLALARSGLWGGSAYAVPVAMGGYLWAYNAALIDGIPDTWQDGGAMLAAPGAEDWRHWGAALLALCAGTYAADSGDEASRDPVALPGLDLGLSLRDAAPAPTSTPAADDAERLPCRLPDDFRFDDDAWRRFVNGEAAAMPVTQREARRLQALTDQGRGPDWRLATGSGAFSDQLLSLAVVDRPDADAQRALCLEFLSLLLEDECQGELYRISAFAVTDAPSGYGAGDPLATLDAALRDTGLAVPNTFDSGWRTAADGIVRDFAANAGESPYLWRVLCRRLAENPNNGS